MISKQRKKHNQQANQHQHKKAPSKTNKIEYNLFFNKRDFIEIFILA